MLLVIVLMTLGCGPDRSRQARVEANASPTRHLLTDANGAAPSARLGPPAIQTLFPTLVAPSIVPAINLDSALDSATFAPRVGFSADSRLFAWCNLDCCSDVPPCGLVCAGDGSRTDLSIVNDGAADFQRRVADRETLLDSLRIASRQRGAWRFADVEFIHSVRSAGAITVLQVGLAHRPSQTRIVIDSLVMSIDSGGASLAGIMVSPDQSACAIVYHIVKYGDLDVLAPSVSRLDPLVARLYRAVGEKTAARAAWPAAFEAYRRCFALDTADLAAAFEAACCALRARDVPAARPYLEAAIGCGHHPRRGLDDTLFNPLRDSVWFTNLRNRLRK